MQNYSVMRRIWRVIYPMLIYGVVQLVVGIVGAIVLGSATSNHLRYIVRRGIVIGVRPFPQYLVLCGWAWRTQPHECHYGKRLDAAGRRCKGHECRNCVGCVGSFSNFVWRLRLADVTASDSRLKMRCRMQ